MTIIKKSGHQAAQTRGSALRLTRTDPVLAAAVTKAIPGNMGNAYDGKGGRAPIAQQLQAFYGSLTKRSRRNSDSLAIMRMLPDVELSAQIVVSSILSPKDMMEPELIYSTNTDDFQSDLATSLVGRLREHFERDYPILDYIADMVREPLFEKGSYPVAVLPENAIDQVINGSRVPSMESLDKIFLASGAAKPIGLLGSGKSTAPSRRNGKFGVSMEDFSKKADVLPEEEYFVQYEGLEDLKVNHEECLFVTDNPAALKSAELLKFLQERRVKKTYQAAMESTGYNGKSPITDRMIEHAIFKNRPIQQAQTVEVPSQIQTSRRSVGAPLVMKLPSESVIPVHVPGDPSKHIGYYVVLDENGHPLFAPDSDSMQPSIGQDQSGGLQSSLIQRAAINLGATDATRFDANNYLHMQAAVRVYSDMIERDLINRIKNGSLGATAALADNEQIYRLMLSRVLARKYTQILYIPLEYMTYIAFKFGDDGLGRSLLDDQSMINMFRATLLFSEVIGSVKNAIGRTSVTGTLPENDPDPMATVEKITHEIVRSRMMNLPTGVSSPTDIMSFVQQASFDFNWSGHPGVPDLKLEFTQTNTNYQKPDTDLSDKLRKSSIMGFGLSPETVDNGFNSEFATTALANNILFSKRVVVWSKKFSPQLTQHMRQHARFTEGLVNDLRKLLEDNREKILIELEKVQGVQASEELDKQLVVEYALQRFLDTFSVSLPMPSSVTMESQMNELKNYADMLEVGLEAHITADLFTETTAGELSQQVATLRAMVKAYLLRKFMADKGILTEFSELVDTNVNGEPQSTMVAEIKAHIQSMSKAGVTTLAGLFANRTAVAHDLNGINAVPDEGGNTGGGYDAGSSGGDLGGFDFGGDADLGLDDGATADEASDTASSEQPADDTDQQQDGTDVPADDGDDSVAGTSAV